jgi:hypothetical protein
MKTKVRNPEAIAAAARKLGFEVLPAGQFRGYYGLAGKADIILRHPDCKYDVGLVLNRDDSYTITTDFWRYGNKQSMTDLIGANGSKLIAEVTRHNATEASELEGFFVEDTEDDEFITLELTRF